MCEGGRTRLTIPQLLIGLAPQAAHSRSVLPFGPRLESGTAPHNPCTYSINSTSRSGVGVRIPSPLS